MFRAVRVDGLSLMGAWASMKTDAMQWTRTSSPQAPTIHRKETETHKGKDWLEVWLHLLLQRPLLLASFL